MTTLSPTALSGLERRIAMSRSGRWLLHARGGDVDLVDLLGAMPLRTLPAINDPARPMIDRFLIEQIIAGDRSALRDQIAREVSSDAPLVRHGVVEVDPAPVSLFARLSVSDALLDSLREFIGRARHRRTVYAARTFKRGSSRSALPRPAVVRRHARAPARGAAPVAGWLGRTAELTRLRPRLMRRDSRNSCVARRDSSSGNSARISVYTFMQ